MFLRIPLLFLLRRPPCFFAWLGFSVLFFDLNFFFLSKFPSTNFELQQCQIGGALTLGNIVFSVVFSALLSLIFVGFFILLSRKNNFFQKTVIGTTSGVGAVFGLFTILCPLCLFGFISIFGVTFSLYFFTEFHLFFQFLSLGILFVNLYVIQHHLKQECVSCLWKRKE